MPVVTYTVSDGSSTDTSTLEISVTPVVDIVGDAITTNEDTAVTFNPVTGVGVGADHFDAQNVPGEKQSLGLDRLG